MPQQRCKRTDGCTASFSPSLALSVSRDILNMYLHMQIYTYMQTYTHTHGYAHLYTWRGLLCWQLQSLQFCISGWGFEGSGRSEPSDIDLELRLRNPVTRRNTSTKLRNPKTPNPNPLYPTQRLHSSSFLGLLYRILNMNPPKGTTMEPMGRPSNPRPDS